MDQSSPKSLVQFENSKERFVETLKNDCTVPPENDKWNICISAGGAARFQDCSSGFLLFFLISFCAGLKLKGNFRSIY